MFSNSSVTHGNFSSHVSRLLQSGDLYDEKTSKKAANKGPSCGTLTISLKIDLINIQLHKTRSNKLIEID